MFGIDFSEILVIFGIALVVLGPEKLPKLAATIGRWVGRARAMARQFREQLEQEAESLRRNADLQASAPPTPAPPEAPAYAAPPAAAVPPAAEARAPAPTAPATHANGGTGHHERAALNPFKASDHHDEPAPPPAEPHERGR